MYSFRWQSSVTPIKFTVTPIKFTVTSFQVIWSDLFKLVSSLDPANRVLSSCSKGIFSCVLASILPAMISQIILPILYSVLWSPEKLNRKKLKFYNRQYFQTWRLQMLQLYVRKPFTLWFVQIIFNLFFKILFIMKKIFLSWKYV